MSIAEQLEELVVELCTVDSRDINIFALRDIGHELEVLAFQVAELES